MSRRGRTVLHSVKRNGKSSSHHQRKEEVTVGGVSYCPAIKKEEKKRGTTQRRKERLFFNRKGGEGLSLGMREAGTPSSQQIRRKGELSRFGGLIHLFKRLHQIA